MGERTVRLEAQRMERIPEPAIDKLQESELSRGEETARSAGKGILQSWSAGAQNCSWRKLSLISDFLQELVFLSCR
jgi:hypothetical protein